MKTDAFQKVLIGIGSNMGNRAELCCGAVDTLKGHAAIRGVTLSSFYETAPVGVIDQPPFLNLTAVFETTLMPEALLKVLKKIEQDLGRKKRYRWGPREIDLDILLYGNQVFETPSLVIPHPEMHNRAFVLTPACDICADWVHPVFRQPLRTLLAQVAQDGIGPYREDVPCA